MVGKGKEDRWQERVLREREQFSTGVLEVLLRQLVSVESRQDVAEWMAYHSAHEKAITMVWKREVLSAKIANVPQLLFAAGDLLQITCVKAPKLAAAIGTLLPRVVVTLLHKTRKEGTSSTKLMHRAVHDLISTLSTSPLLPKEWLRGMRTALESSVENANCGWIHEGLRAADDLWTEAGELIDSAQHKRTKLDELYSELYSRQVEGTPEVLSGIAEVADAYLKQCDEFEAKLETIRKELDSKVVSYNQKQLAQVDEERGALAAIRKRNLESLGEVITSPSKAARTDATPTTKPEAPPSEEDDFDSDSEEDSDAKRIVLPGA
eukprot:TRINITY_DN45156_c0_g1_i1.p1 TRINITY_DN45156_c0_g1~~TRINITY_DN45156_c0_g1_i1.p1  ORF type:complete len:331 (+),score=129.46 TRINITY_DN45156_c0_g1_i1:30-995(+)